MVRKLFSLILQRWSGLILLSLRLIVVINNFRSEIILLFLVLHLLQRHSHELFQLFYFLIDFNVSQIFLICCRFYLLYFLFNSCQLLLFELLNFLFLFLFHFLFVWVAHSALFLFWLMCVVLMLYFLHFLHQLVLGSWCLL